jgi:hypothetical protein
MKQMPPTTLINRVLPFDVLCLLGLGLFGWVLPADATPSQKWYERLSLRGYTQIRYNRLLETNPLLKCEQCDKSWGENGSFFVRRARLILSGDVHERVFAYIQPDLASQDAGIAQLRDLYFDLALDSEKEFRIRFGQSKVPYGFENLQSSSNRLPLDRADSFNSAQPNERDLGVFLYWAPQEIRQRFRQLIDQGLKGSGDYGVLGFGFSNGQTPNQMEADDTRMMVARVTYPFQLNSGQFFEASVQGYINSFEPIKPPKVELAGESPNRDRRIGASFVWYPQPFGIQAEYNWGDGPAFDSSTQLIRNQTLQGGYLQAMLLTQIGEQKFNPFARYQVYDGGKKQEQDARLHRVRELDVGIEWLPLPAFELTLDYVVSARTTRDSSAPNNEQSGSLLRVQAQFNY